MFTERSDFMSPTPITLARTMANAMNRLYGTHIVINVSQFFGGEGKLVRMYAVKDAFNYHGQYSNKELFCSASGIYVCLFMRDLLYTFQGKEVPDEDNEGYKNVLARKNGKESIDYMVKAYLETTGGEDDE